MAKFERCIHREAEPLKEEVADKLYHFSGTIENARREAEEVMYLLGHGYLLNCFGHKRVESIHKRLMELENDVVDIINVLDERDII